MLRSVVRSKPELSRCRTRCQHCGIFFLTSPRNAGREDLRCPFGCREAHRKKQSTLRSVAYYQDPEGKRKKRDQNTQRRKTRTIPHPAPPDPLPWPRSILEYIRGVVSLIEGRKVHFPDIVAMLRRTVRQHSMVRTRSIDQGVAWLNAKPP